MDEAGLSLGAVDHRGGIAGRHLDEIAEYVIVLDLQRFDASFFGILQLQAGDYPPRLVAKRAHFIEVSVRTFPQEAAITLQERQVVRQQRYEEGLQDRKSTSLNSSQ